MSQRYRRIGESDDREHGQMVLGEIRTSMSWPVRNRGARNTNCALHLSRGLTSTPESNWLRQLQLNRVPFQLIIESWSLNPQQFGCFFLVPAAFSERMQNCVPLQVIKSLNALSR